MTEVTVGRSILRSDAFAKVTGTADFPGDLHRENMLHLKILYARRAHARIIHIDTTQAAALPGVEVILTAADVPVNNYGIGSNDQPVLCSDIVRFVGERVALVVAETEVIAAQARDLIRVEYEDLPVLDSPQAALAPAAPALHKAHPDNSLVSFRVRKGDVAVGFAEAVVVVEETYHMGAQEHAYLQPDAGLAWIDEEGRVVVKSAGQWAHDDRRQIARSLDVPEEQVRVQYAAIGGAFGGREDLTVQIPLALAALKTGRPVKTVCSREETTIGHPKRHPMTIKHKWGAKRDGRLVAQETEIVADAGAYASTSDYVLATTVLMSSGPYDVPHVSIDAQAVYTNNPIYGAFRGFGAPQAVFAAESQMARLAAALGIDPVELRMRNFLKADSRTGTMGVVPPGLSAQETLEAAALAAGWACADGQWEYPQSRREDRPGVWRGVGIAAGWKPTGYTLGWRDEATATIELHGGVEIERALVRLSASEMGQGIATTIVQMAAEALHLPVEMIELCDVDTSKNPDSGPTSASRLALMAGNTLRGAARAAWVAWCDEERPAVGTFTYKAPPTEALDPETGHGSGAYAIGYLAQAVELEVDVSTGKIEVLRVISAHDVGKAINPQIVEGQIEGGAIQGVGYATCENFITQGGVVLTPDMSTYLIPTAVDVPPEFEAIILESNLAVGPWGANGIGEMPLVAMAPAICDAVHHATDRWCNSIPLTQETLYQHLNNTQGA